MLILLSPLKTQDYSKCLCKLKSNEPALLGETQKLLKLLKSLDQAGLAKLLGVSPKIAKQNVERYRDFYFNDLGYKFSLKESDKNNLTFLRK